MSLLERERDFTGCLIVGGKVLKARRLVVVFIVLVAGKPGLAPCPQAGDVTLGFSGALVETVGAGGYGGHDARFDVALEARRAGVEAGALAGAGATDAQ